MKKFKLITPVVASVSTLAVLASSITAVKLSSNKPLEQKDKATDVNAKAISIPYDRDEIYAREFMRSQSTSIVWTPDGKTVEDSQLTKIDNSAFAYSKLKSFTIPKGVMQIDPMAFFHAEDMEVLDLSLVQSNMLEKNFVLGTHAFQDMGPKTYGNGYIFKSLANSPEAYSSMDIYDVTIAYLKAMLTYAGAPTGWMNNIKLDDGSGYQTTAASYKAIPIQLMNFDADGKLTGFAIDKIKANSSKYDSIAFPKFMTGMTADGESALKTIRELGTIKNVGFISNTAATTAAEKITIKSNWFKGWDTLERIILPSHTTAIEKSAFSNCSKLQYINMENVPITELPQNVLYNAGENGGGLTVLFPKTLTSISEDSLTGSKILVLDIPENVTTIEESAGEDMTSLTTIAMNSKTTSIGDYAFAGCTALKQIQYPKDSKLLSIGESAFDGCQSLSTFTLPTSLGQDTNGTVGASAFASSNSNKCTSIDLSNFSQTQMGKLTFENGCFSGWPTRGSVVMNSEWTSTFQDQVMQKLYNAGLSTRWSKSNDVLKDDVLCVQYDAGVKLVLNGGDFATEETPDVQYSYTGKSGSWTVLTKNTPLTLDPSKSCLYLKGKNPTGFTKKSQGEGYTEIGILSFINDDTDASAGVTISGNILGLIDNGTKTATEIPNEHCFDKLFYGATALKSVDPNFLSVSKLQNNCYQGMFYGCKNLTTAPLLPATELKDECYMNMFGGTGLTAMPTLSATTLKKGCYKGMFYNCDKLVTARNLNIPNIVLAENCFQNMFMCCTSMQNPPKLPETDDTNSVSVLKKGCYYGMFEGCSALSTAPELKAYVFPEDSARQMFKDCTSLVNAPTITIKSSVIAGDDQYGLNCFASMYENDIALRSIKVEFNSWPTASSLACTSGWAKGLCDYDPEHCIFTCSEDLPHEAINFNIDQIPINWSLNIVEKKKDYESDDANDEAYAEVDKKTNVSLFKSDKFKNDNKSIDLWYRIKKTDGTWKNEKWTKFSDTSVSVDAGEKIYFRGQNSAWGYKTSDTWSTSYASIVFTNPNGYNYGSTGVHLKGNVMSLVLENRGIKADGTDDKANMKYRTSLDSEFCFYGLFMGPATADEQATSNEQTKYNNHEYNYCISDFAEGFMSVSNLTYGMFARSFCHLENMITPPKVWSREGKGFRSTKRFAFADTFKGCNKMTEPCDMNLDEIPTWQDGFWTFHGTYYQCASIKRAAITKITDISKIKGGSSGATFAENNCQTWQLCYHKCTNMEEMYWYAKTKSADYAKSWHTNIFDGWTTNCGTGYYKVTETWVGRKKVITRRIPVLYMYDDFYTWIKNNFSSNMYGGGNGNIPISSSQPWVIRSITSGNILNTDKYSESDFE